MKCVLETIIVEGRYDANTLSQCVDAHIIETSGFGIFNNKEKRRLIERLAEKNGIIVLTDSDGAGLVIRNHIASIARGKIKHAYIPEIEGKERRKITASKAGLVGVEGMSPDVLINALRRAGATFTDEPKWHGAGITKQDMYGMGLSGGEKSAEKRALIAKKLDLPQNLSANAFLAAVNMIFTREEFENAVACCAF